MSNAKQEVTESAPVLVPLDEAVKPYLGMRPRTLRKRIHQGRLPATKIGPAYYVSPADVAALFAPTLRTPPPATRREAEETRVDRQLAAAGVARR